MDIRQLTGVTLILDIEKPAAGGRMLARHEGLVVLVSGAIPGERVSARVERVGKGVAYASTREVLTPSVDRRTPTIDVQCGGQAFAYIDYARQLQLKGEIVQDALARIGRMPLAAPPPVAGSPATGYRMRARLHAQGDRLGFFREGTHQLCDAGATAQLLPATNAWIEETQRLLSDHHLHGLAAIEIAEDVPGDTRACHLELHDRVDSQPFTVLAGGLTGLSAGHDDTLTLAGDPTVADDIRPSDQAARTFELRRHVRAFFQGNRFLIEPLARHVAARTAGRPVVDLYAGVGLFGLAAASVTDRPVTLVEGEPLAYDSLRDNASPFGPHVTTVATSVEAFLAASTPLPDHTVIVDPPRTGLARDALAGLLHMQPARLIYVSCDAATLARDARLLCDTHYELHELSGFDLFPNTPHVETVAVFDRG